MYAVEAMTKLGEKSWIPLAEKRLPSMEYGSVARMKIAEYLALSGSYVGWPLLKAEILDPKIDKFRMLSLMGAMPAFVSMTDSSGKPVDAIADLQALLPKVAPEHYERLLLTIRHLTTMRHRPTTKT